MASRARSALAQVGAGSYSPAHGSGTNTPEVAGGGSIVQEPDNGGADANDLAWRQVALSDQVEGSSEGIVGRIERSSHNSVSGWAWDPLWQDESIEVELLGDAGVLLKIHANQP